MRFRNLYVFFLQHLFLIHLYLLFLFYKNQHTLVSFVTCFQFFCFHDFFFRHVHSRLHSLLCQDRFLNVSYPNFILTSKSAFHKPLFYPTPLENNNFQSVSSNYYIYSFHTPFGKFHFPSIHRTSYHNQMPKQHHSHGFPLLSDLCFSSV